MGLVKCPNCLSFNSGETGCKDLAFVSKGGQRLKRLFKRRKGLKSFSESTVRGDGTPNAFKQSTEDKQTPIKEKSSGSLFINTIMINSKFRLMHRIQNRSLKFILYIYYLVPILF